MISEVYNMDCMKYMRNIPDKFFDLAVVDPPYGLDKKSTHGRGKLKDRCLNRGNIQRWDVRPGQEYFDELFRVSKNQIIWGGNYFPLPPTRCFVCWAKIGNVRKKRSLSIIFENDLQGCRSDRGQRVL